MINFNKNIVVLLISLSATTSLHANFLSWCVKNSTLQKYDNSTYLHSISNCKRTAFAIESVSILPSKEDLLDILDGEQ